MQYINETNEIILCKNDYVRMGLDYYKFIGSVDKISEVPVSNCLYTIDGLLYIRKIDLNRLKQIKAIKEPVVKNVDDTLELDLKIKPGDDSTLIIVKELLKGFTKSMFRQLFDNDSDMNNMRRAIEKSPNGQLSLNRFKYILNKLGLKYKIIVFADDVPQGFTEEEFKTKIENINTENFGSDQSNDDIEEASEDEEEVKESLNEKQTD